MTIKKIDQMNGFTIVEVMIVAGIIGLLAAITIPNLIAMKRTANEAAARSNIRALCTAAETFVASRAQYPTSVEEFQDFLSSAGNFCQDTSGTKTQVQGYNYACTMTNGGYTFEASPVTAGTTGNIIYTGTTGSILTP